MWYMPSGAGAVTLDLAVAGTDSTLITPAPPANLRVGLNMWTLGRPELDGTTTDFNFTVIGGTGMVAAPFTLRLVQRELFADNSWSALVTAPGLDASIALTYGSAASAGLIPLPASAAFGAANVTLQLPAGAVVNPAMAPGGVLSVPLGARGTNNSLTFTVISESGVAAEPFTVTFNVAQFNDNSWSALVAAPGLDSPVALTHESDASAGLIPLPAGAALGTATVTLVLPGGAVVSPATAPGGVLTVPLGAAGTNSSRTFTVSAENGVAAAPFTITFMLDAPAAEPDSSSTGMPSGGESSSGSDGTAADSSTADAASADSSTATDSDPTSSSSSTGSDATPAASSTGVSPTAASSTGSAAPSATYANATLTMQLNYTGRAIPLNLVEEIKAGITAATRFPSRVGQLLLAILQYLNSGGALRRRLLQSGEEVMELQLTFVPADSNDVAAYNVSTALHAQLECATPQCAAAIASASGFLSIYDSPILSTLPAVLVPLSLKVTHGKSDPHVDPPGPNQPPPSDDGKPAGGSNLTNGAVAAIVVGVVIGAALLVGAALMVVQAQRAKERAVGSTASAASAPAATEMTAV